MVCENCNKALRFCRVVRGVTLGRDCAARFVMCRSALSAERRTPNEMTSGIAANWRRNDPRLCAMVEAAR